MADSSQPKELMHKKKPEGFEMQHIDKIEVINFDSYKLHFFTSLTLYTIMIIGNKDSSVIQTTYLEIYRSLCDYVLKDPNYPVTPLLPGKPASKSERQLFGV